MWLRSCKRRLRAIERSSPAEARPPAAYTWVDDQGQVLSEFQASRFPLVPMREVVGE